MSISYTESDLQAAVNLWLSISPSKPTLAMLTTASAAGVPHATWMGAISAPEPGQILSLTSPDSRKVGNLRENPKVEWMFSEMNRKKLLYLGGRAELVEDVADLKECWKNIPGKGQAFFLRYFNSGPGFAVIRTRVESVVLVVPEEFRKVSIPLSELVRSIAP